MIPLSHSTRSVGILSLVLLVGCSNQIRRTALSPWRSCNLGDSGVIVEIPSRATLVNDMVMLHERSNGPLSDSTFFITISVRNRTAEFFAASSAASNSSPAANDPGYDAWASFMNAYHKGVDVLPSNDTSRHTLHYRRDVALPDATVASIKAEYSGMWFSEDERAADDAAIRRILTSARPNGRPAAEWTR